MNIQQDPSAAGFSEANERLLRVCFDKVSERGSTLDYEFDEQDVEQWSDDNYSSVDTDPNYPWRSFFNEIDEGKWLLDPEKLTKIWCATLEKKHRVTVNEIQKSKIDSRYDVTVDGGNRGKVEFRLHFDAEKLLKDNANPRESQFLIAFDIPRSGIDRDMVYPWQKVTNGDFWQDISDLLIELQGPPAQELYAPKSYVDKNMPGGPKRTLKAITESDGSLEFNQQPQLIDNIKNAGDEIRLNNLTSAVEIDDVTHLVTCNCTDTKANALHLHLIEGGETQQLEGTKRVSDAIDILENKVNNYNDLKDDRKNTGKFVKLTLGLLTVGALPAINAVVSMITNEQLKLEPAVLTVLNIIFLLAVFAFFLMTIQPMFELWHFSWDRDVAYENARERVVSMISSALR